MAQVSTITSVARQRTTRLIDDLSEVGPILDLIEDVGATDAERQVYFETYIGTLGAADLTWPQFLAAIIALRALRTWLQTNRPALSKLRI